MNGQEKLKGNLACARLLGMHNVESTNSRVICTKTDDEKIRFSNMVEVDIFTNPAQCLEVVKKLGDDYGIAIIPFVLGVNTKVIGWFWHNAKTSDESKCMSTLEQAAVAAAIEVMEREGD